MTPTQSIQLAGEALLGALCIAGYMREAGVAREIRLLPPRAVAPVLEVRAVGDGEWVVLGISEESTFDSASATPELESTGFELDTSQGRVAVAKGAKVTIRAVTDARRVPQDALVTTEGVKPRFTFEVRPGTLLYSDVGVSNPHVYRTDNVVRETIVIAGTAAGAARARTTVAPGCWIVMLLAGVLGAVTATVSEWERTGWVFLALTTTAVAIGWLVMPKASDELSP